MAKIMITPLVISAGLGIVDEVVEGFDRKRDMVKPYRNATDWFRALTLGGGIVMTMTNTRPDVGQVLSNVGAALTVKSLSRTFREGLSLGGSRATPALRATRMLNAGRPGDGMQRVSLEPLVRRSGLS